MSKYPLTGALWTLAQLNSELDTYLSDTADARWTSAEKNTAINQAIEDAWDKWHYLLTIDSDELEYDEDTHKYTLPAPNSWDRIVNLYLSHPDDDSPRHHIPQTHWHQEGAFLFMHKEYQNYDAEHFELSVMCRPWALYSSATGTDGAIGAASTTFSSAGATFSTWGIRVGDVLFVQDGDSEWVWRSITSITSETALVMHKSVSASALTSKTWHIGKYTNVPKNFVLFKAASILYERAARQGSGKDVEESMQWAAYETAKAERERAKFNQLRQIRKW